jgi:hypothetical protein
MAYLCINYYESTRVHRCRPIRALRVSCVSASNHAVITFVYTGVGPFVPCRCPVFQPLTMLSSPSYTPVYDLSFRAGVLHFSL